MNEVMNAILTRRSIRKFTADPIPAEVLEDLVKAALHAPSGMGKQTWQFNRGHKPGDHPSSLRPHRD